MYYIADNTKNADGMQKMSLSAMLQSLIENKNFKPYMVDSLAYLIKKPGTMRRFGSESIFHGIRLFNALISNKRFNPKNFSDNLFSLRAIYLASTKPANVRLLENTHPLLVDIIAHEDFDLSNLNSLGTFIEKTPLLDSALASLKLYMDRDSYKSGQFARTAVAIIKAAAFFKRYSRKPNTMLAGFTKVALIREPAVQRLDVKYAKNYLFFFEEEKPKKVAMKSNKKSRI
jgi:hypothetical protein